MTAQESQSHRSATTPDRKTDAARGARSEPVGNLTLRPFVCIAPSATLGEAFGQMQQAETDGIFVCEEESVVGVLTHRNVLARSADGQLNATTLVSDLMATDVCTVGRDATLGEIVRLMNENERTHIAVVEGKQFVGAISDMEIITYLAESYPKETINLPPVAAQVMDTREGG